MTLRFVRANFGLSFRGSQFESSRLLRINQSSKKLEVATIEKSAQIKETRQKVRTLRFCCAINQRTRNARDFKLSILRPLQFLKREFSTKVESSNKKCSSAFYCASNSLNLLATLLNPSNKETISCVLQQAFSESKTQQKQCNKKGAKFESANPNWAVFALEFVCLLQQF